MTTEIQHPLESFLLLRTLPSTDQATPPFEAVSESLKKNPILQKSDTFDAKRLNPGALKNLYLKLLKEEVRLQAASDQNGIPPTSPRKRKLSSPRLESIEEASNYTHLIPGLIERLYHEFQKATTQAIFSCEQQYRLIRDKIEKGDQRQDHTQEQRQEVPSKPASHGVPSIQTLLRHGEDSLQKDENEEKGRAPSDVGYAGRYRASPHAITNGTAFPPPPPNSEHRPSTQQGTYRHAPPITSAENRAPYLPPIQNHPQVYPLAPNDYQTRRPSQPSAAPSPSVLPAQTSSMSPQERASASPIILPPVPGMLRSPSNSGPPEAHPESAAPTRRAAPNSSPRQTSQSAPWPSHQGRLPPPRGYPPQPYPYQENPNYPVYHHYNPQYHAHSYHAPAAPHGPSYPAASPYQTPVPPQYSNYHASQQYYNPVPYSQHPASVYGDQHTPNAQYSGKRHPPPITPITTSVSSTKWKDVDLHGAKAPGSPTRPQSRDVSPISARSPSPEPESSKTGRRFPRQKEDPSKPFKAAVRGRLSTRSGRGAPPTDSPASTRGRTRSHSITPNADELRGSRVSAMRKVKPEPSVASEDVSALSPAAEESPRRSDRRRPHDARGDQDRPTTPRTVAKRKRADSSSVALPSPSLRSSLTGSAHQRSAWPRKPGFVLAVRNLARSSSVLLNTITAHKFASLFAKPLTEREAPGYTSFILRGQDLKSIKAAMSAGSRAVASITEQAADEIPPGTNLIWVPESEDVMPPRAIVNSAQLEMEIVRIFANAIMFNPETDENRGFGGAFHATARTLRQLAGNEEDESMDKHEIGVAKAEAGAVVKDSRDMYGSVDETLDDWRGIGAVSEEEAQDAPVVGNPGEQSGQTRKGRKAVEEEEDEVDEGTNTEDVSEEPRAKRRRR